MRLIESADGTIQVVELDPTKAHIVFLDADAVYLQNISLRDGTIIMKRPGGGVAIVEGERDSIETTVVRVLSDDEVTQRRQIESETDGG